ncbi:protein DETOXIFICATION 44, chloroplastic-like [Primulina huaijiensis]|uniref:protein DETOXIFICATION 44, chloroplastic-like n=1 Tax=Primulina huaijiensis TaxID=1492673 RepID=UPI003CC755D9
MMFLAVLFRRVLVLSLRSAFKLNVLGMKILSIALPATLALAADPIASLVDTAYVGHLGALLTGRTIAVLMTTTLATSIAAHEGSGHQICFKVWLALSLLSDGLALVGQAPLASDYSQGNYGLARQLVYKVLQVGLIMGLDLAVILFIGFGALSSLFSPDSEVFGIARSGTLPMNAIAFVLDGLYYGVSDFGFAAYSLALVGLISSVFILMTVPLFGLTGVWSGLFLFMTFRVFAGVFRLSSRTGPWRLLWPDNEKDNT